MAMTDNPGWLKRGIALAEEHTKNWPQWRKDAGAEDFPMTEKPPVPSDNELQHIYDYDRDDATIARRQLWLAGYHAREVRISELEAEVAVVRTESELNFTSLQRAQAEVAELKKRCEEWEAHYDDLEKEVVELRERLEAERAIRRGAVAAFCKERLRGIGNPADATDPFSEQFTKRIDDALRRGRYDSVDQQRERVLFAIDDALGVSADDERVADGLMAKRAATLESRPMPRRTPELTERVARELIALYGATFSEPLHTSHLWRARRILDLVFGKERE